MRDFPDLQQQILEYVEARKWFFYPLGILMALILAGITLSLVQQQPFILSFGIVTGVALLGLISYRFYLFYTGPSRLEQKFNQFHASHFLTIFFKIYFPVVIVAFILQTALTFALVPERFGGLGLLDFERISPSTMLSNIVFTLVLALGIMALVDYEMKKNNLHYSDKVNSMPFVKSFGYIIPLSGLYFGAIFVVRFILRQVYGPGAIIPSSSQSFAIDQGVRRAARFWDLLTDTERDLILVAFIVAYIAMELLMRGLIASQAKGYKLGPTGIVIMPAVLQATAFSSGMLVFTDTIFYFFELFDALLFGLIMGLILWRTGNMKAVIGAALFVKILDTRLEFQTTVLHLLPRAFGEYNPVDGVNSLADTIGVYFVYTQIALVAIAPFVIIVSYQEVGRIISGLLPGLKEQWFGILALGIAFFLIDIVFSLVFSLGIGLLFGYILALLVIGFVLRYFFKILPEPTEPPILHSDTDMFDGELPLNVRNDLEFLDRSPNWYDNPKIMGILGGGLYLYFLFLSATYRQFTGLTPLETVKFVVFLITLPTVIIGVALYLIIRAHDSGYFFAENWRSSVIIFSIVMFALNVFIWTNSSSTVNFAWRNVPFGIVFILLVRPKPIEKPTRDLALGLARDGRYATFRYIEDKHDIFEPEFPNLVDLPSDNIQVGAYILAAKQNLLDGDDLIHDLRERAALDRGIVIGMILALGIMKYRPAEGLLLDVLADEDVEIKMAAYWVLGKIASERSLGRMAKILEENPKKDLLPVAEHAILSIDPNYPLTGIRDSISIS